MFDSTDFLGVLSEYFPESSMATGVKCAADLTGMFNAQIASQSPIYQPRVASSETMAAIADLIVRNKPHSKITCIRDYRFAFPNEGLKESKDAIEQAYLRNGFDLSGRKFTDADSALRDPMLSDPWRPDRAPLFETQPVDEPLAPWEQELLKGTTMDPTLPENTSDEPPF